MELGPAVFHCRASRIHDFNKLICLILVGFVCYILKENFPHPSFSKFRRMKLADLETTGYFEVLLQNIFRFLPFTVHSWYTYHL